MNPKSLIIDDNPFIIDSLSDQIRQHHPEIEIIGNARSGREGLEKLRTLKPGLVFLDVEMPDMTGFDLLGQLREITFQTIFITSFSHYAIKAIRFNALDYLLKPIEEEELRQAIRRFYANLGKTANQEHIQQALDNLKTETPQEQKLFLQTQEGELRLPLKNIVSIEGERNYSYIHLANNTKKLSSKTLGHFEEILSDKGFFRCHRSFLVNGHYVQGLQGPGHFLLHNGNLAPISRRKKSEATAWFREYLADNEH